MKLDGNGYWKPKERNPLEAEVKAEVKRLEREKRVLERRLKRAELLVTIQKKLRS